MIVTGVFCLLAGAVIGARLSVYVLIISLLLIMPFVFFHPAQPGFEASLSSLAVMILSLQTGFLLTAFGKATLRPSREALQT